MSYNSIVAAQNSEVTHAETGAATPRARPMSRLAVVRHLYACSPPLPVPAPVPLVALHLAYGTSSSHSSFACAPIPQPAPFHAACDCSLLGFAQYQAEPC